MNVYVYYAYRKPEAHRQPGANTQTKESIREDRLSDSLTDLVDVAVASFVSNF